MWNLKDYCIQMLLPVLSKFWLHFKETKVKIVACVLEVRICIKVVQKSKQGIHTHRISLYLAMKKWWNNVQ